MSQALPAPWVAVRTDDGEVYYWNEQTDETSWEKPVVRQAPPPPARPQKPQKPARSPMASDSPTGSMVMTFAAAEASTVSPRIPKRGPPGTAASPRPAGLPLSPTADSHRRPSQHSTGPSPIPSPAVSRKPSFNGIPGLERVLKWRASDGGEEDDLRFITRTYTDPGEASARCLAIQLQFEDVPINFRQRILIREGPLQKMNRDGPKTYQFFLLADAILYAKVNVITNKYVLSRELPLTTCTVCPPEGGKTGHTFRLMCRQKSFYVTCSSAEEKQSWYEQLETITRDVQRTVGIRLEEKDCAPIWEANEDVPDCQLCGRGFGFMSRRHHCRNCGKCVCANCSLEKTRIERIDPKTLFLVCNPCAREIKSTRRYGVNNIQSPPKAGAASASARSEAKR